jgi:predicted transcriptional regulator
MVKKKRPRSSAPHKSLTPAELDLMTAIWSLGPCTVTQVQERLRPERPLAYTSVFTIVRILEQKGFVTSRKVGRGHVYHPVVSKETYQAGSLGQLVHTVFDGAPSLVVRHLLDSGTLTPEELDEIEARLRTRDR